MVSDAKKEQLVHYGVWKDELDHWLKGILKSCLEELGFLGPPKFSGIWHRLLERTF